MRISSTPAETASSTMYCRTGLSTRGSISFGMLLVLGSRRVPRPAAGMIAFRTFMGSSPFTPHSAGKSFPVALFDEFAEEFQLGQLPHQRVADQIQHAGLAQSDPGGVDGVKPGMLEDVLPLIGPGDDRADDDRVEHDRHQAGEEPVSDRVSLPAEARREQAGQEGGKRSEDDVEDVAGEEVGEDAARRKAPDGAGDKEGQDGQRLADAKLHRPVADGREGDGEGRVGGGDDGTGGQEQRADFARIVHAWDPSIFYCAKGGIQIAAGSAHAPSRAHFLCRLPAQQGVETC